MGKFNRILDGGNITLYNTDNIKSGTLSLDANGAIKVTGSGSHVTVSAGNNLIFAGATATLRGTNSILTIGATGDTIEFPVGVTFSGPFSITGSSPTAPTQTTSDSSTKIATTAFVNAEIANDAPAETTATIGPLINGAIAKSTIANADMFGLMDSAASNVLKKLSWTNLKVGIKTYTDTLYNKYSHATGFTNQPTNALTGAAVVSQVTVNSEGHVTGVATRNLTAANISAAPASHTHGISDITPVTSQRLIGRATASSGAAEEITMAGGGTTSLSWNATTKTLTISSADSKVGTVTSVAAGNGMNFTAITTSGSVTMGTPSTLTASTTNATTSTSHTHAITGFSETGHSHANDHAPGSDNQKVFTKFHALNSSSAEVTNSPYSVASQTDSIKLKAGSNVTLSMSSNVVTIASSYTNTTYSAGNGLKLSTTTFSVDPKTAAECTSGSEGVIVSDSEGIAVSLGTTGTTAAAGNHTHSNDHASGSDNQTITSGNGMNFTSGSGNVTVTLGTPSNSSGSTSNAVTSTSHTHKITGFRSDSWLPPNDHSHSNKTNLDTVNQDMGTSHAVQFTKIGIGAATAGDHLDVNGAARIRSSNSLKFGGTGASDAKFEIQYNSTSNSLDFNYLG